NASSQVSSGKNSSSSANGGIACFLTTACCEHKGLPDDCDELTILRSFRDTHVPKILIKEYYEIAPQIVRMIKNDHTQLDYVYNIITDCVRDIRNNRQTLAVQKYMHMVDK